MNILIKISILLLTGIMGGRLAKLFKIPSITGYLLGGLLIGPSFLGLISEQNIEAFSFVNDIALGAIAFSIGSEFLITDLKKVGKKIFSITLFQGLITIFSVFSILFFILNQSFYFSLLLGTIASATAPAATTMIIKQYHAKGPLTKTILPVVAIDDALCVISFGIAIALTKMSMASGESSALFMFSLPFIEIIGSLVVGFLLGLLLTFLTNKSHNDSETLGIVLAVVIAGTGLAHMIHLSPILTSMMVGATITNVMQNHMRLFRSIDTFTPPIYLFFFTLAGVSLHLSSLGTMGAVGIGYVVARGIGKIFGSYLGCKVNHSPSAVAKNLGLSLLPQAGVAIGLAILVKQEIPGIGDQISTVVLGGVLVYEIIGPISAKFALERAGEISKPSKDKKSEKLVEQQAHS